MAFFEHRVIPSAMVKAALLATALHGAASSALSVQLLFGALVVIFFLPPFRRGQRLWVLGLAFLSVWLVWRAYGQLLSFEAGAALLSAALWLKGIEAEGKRDAEVFGLTLFIVLAALLVRSQSFGQALLVFGGATAVWYGFYQLSCRAYGIAPLSNFGRLAIAALLGMLFLFMVVPRTGALLAWLPRAAEPKAIGLTDTLRPGALVELVAHDRLALTLVWQQPTSGEWSRYLRALVLSDFDGTRWIIGPDSEPFAAAAPLPDRPPDFTLWLEPQALVWVPLPDETQAAIGPKALRFSAQQRTWRLDQPAAETLRFEGWIASESATSRALTAEELARYLRLVPGLDPRTVALGKALEARYPDPEERLAALKESFRAAAPIYTLTPPALSAHVADEILFGHRAGFCEHFAHAFAIAARSAALPARIVLGYQGGIVNPLNGTWVVRTADAHAWVEVWVKGRWQRVDPTLWAERARLEEGIEPFRAALKAYPPGLEKIMQSVQLAYWSALFYWNTYVIGFDERKRVALWQQMGLKEYGTTLGLLALLLLAAGVRFRKSPNSLRDAQERLEKALRYFVPQASAPEGPLGYAERVAQAASVCPEKRLARLLERAALLLKAALYARYAPAGKQHDKALSKALKRQALWLWFYATLRRLALGCKRASGTIGIWRLDQGARKNNEALRL